MDPLSITASVVAVVTVTAKLTNSLCKLRGHREADGLVHALMNEVTTLRAISTRIEAVACRYPGSLSSERLNCLEQLQQVLDAAKVKLEELDNIIHYGLIRPPDDGGIEKLSRRAWLHHKTDVQRIQQELRTLRQDISMLVETLNL